MRRRELMSSNVISSDVIVYDDIEGVSFNGTQYIFTDIDVSNPPYNMTFSFLNQNTAKDDFRNVYSTTSGSLMFVTSYSRRTSSNIISYVALWASASKTIKMTYTDKATLTINSATAIMNGVETAYTYTTPTTPMYLMFGNRFVPTSDGQIESFETSKGWIGLIYGATIEKDGVKHELVPKRRRHDNVEGFYDTQTDKFYEIKQQW